jgi:hypothetical protein
MSRVAVILGLVVWIGLSPAAASAHPGHWYWPYGKLIRAIVGTTVRVEGRRYRVDGELVVCSGTGRPIVRSGTPRWKHFLCTQTLVKGLRTSDITFAVHVTGRSSFVVTGARRGAR